MAAAAVALAGCAKEYVSEQTTSGTELVDVKFNAEIPDYQTTKSTIDVNDLIFTTRWTDGDRMGIRYKYDDGEGYNTQATYSNGTFSSKLPEATGTWFYYAYYPYQAADNATSHYVDIPFDAERVQNGNEFNSSYDIMCAEALDFENAEQGKTDDGKDISFSMVRQTALLYFHFTSPDVDEPLTKATLSVEGDPIAADTYSLYYYGNNLDNSTYGTSWTSGDSQSITLTFTNAPSSKDFTLWFNILPSVEGLRENGVKNMKLVVETANKTLTLTAPAEEMYLPGNISKIEKLDVASTNWKDKETPTPPVTTPVYEKVTSALTDWSGDYLIVYEDASSKTPSPVAFDGSLTKLDQTSNTKSVAISDNKIEATTEMDAISFTIAAIDGGYSIQSASGNYIGRSNNSNGLDESIDNALVNTISYENSTLTIKGVGGAVLRYNAAANQNRFRYFTSAQKVIALYKRSEALPVAPYITLSSESASVAADATSASFEVKSNVSWNVSTDAAWVTLDTTSGSNDGTVKLVFSENEDAEDRTATIIVKSIDEGLSRVYSLTQKSAGSSDEEIAGTLCSWSFTSSSYPANKEDFIASEGSCGKSSLYLNGTGSTWNATRDSWAFTAITDMTINVVVNKKLKAGKKVTLSLDSFYNKAKNAPMKGFSLSVSAGVLDKNSWTLSTTSATYTAVCTLSKDIEPNETVKFTLTQTGKAGAGQGYMSNVKVLYE